jgi:hypothetical protein
MGIKVRRMIGPMFILKMDRDMPEGEYRSEFGLRNSRETVLS